MNVQFPKNGGKYSKGKDNLRINDTHTQTLSIQYSKYYANCTPASSTLSKIAGMRKLTKQCARSLALSTTNTTCKYTLKCEFFTGIIYIRNNTTLHFLIMVQEGDNEDTYSDNRKIRRNVPLASVCRNYYYYHC